MWRVVSCRYYRLIDMTGWLTLDIQNEVASSRICRQLPRRRRLDHRRRFVAERRSLDEMAKSDVCLNMPSELRGNMLQRGVAVVNLNDDDMN